MGTKEIDLDKEAGKTGRIVDLTKYAEGLGGLPIWHEREKGRTRLALGLLALFSVTVLSPIAVWLFCGRVSEDIIQYAKDIGAMELGLLGAAVAFYYQSEKSDTTTTEE